jgi:hypothetical protein
MCFNNTSILEKTVLGLKNVWVSKTPVFLKDSFYILELKNVYVLKTLVF